MSYRVIKTIKGRQYVYEQTSIRNGKQVVTNSRYLGPLVPVDKGDGKGSTRLVRLTRADAKAAVSSAGFRLYLHSATAGFYPVAMLPRSVRKLWPHVERLDLLLSAETKAKIVKRHPEVAPEKYERIQEMIDANALALDARGLVPIFHEIDGQWWKLVIKCTANGEPLVVTFHRSNVAQQRRQKGLR